MEAKKWTVAMLIKEFFSMDARTAMNEYKALSDVDKAHLGSAIARERGIPESACTFAFVAY